MDKKNSFFVNSFIAMILITTALFAPAHASENDNSDIELIKNRGSLLVGITDFAPMDFKDDNGNWIGFDADLARIVAEDLGVDVEFVEINWDNKILELNNKNIDCVWNGMTLTDEVKNSMDTTTAYCNNAQVVALPADIAEDYQDVESLKDLKFAVEAGSAGEAAAREHGFDYTSLTSQSDALLEVEAATSDASIIDLLLVDSMIGDGTRYPHLTHTFELTVEEYAVGCRKGSDLTAFINDELNALYEDGTLEEIAETYDVAAAVIAPGAIIERPESNTVNTAESSIPSASSLPETKPDPEFDFKKFK